MPKRLTITLALACLGTPGLWAQASGASDTEQAQMKAYMDMLRKDVRRDVQTIVDRAMDLEPGDKAKFWTVYESFQQENKALWDKRLANIKKFAENYEAMTDAVAEELAMASLDIEQQKAAIRRKYYTQMKAALGPIVAARFLQVDMMIGHVLGLQIGSEIPLIE